MAFINYDDPQLQEAELELRAQKWATGANEADYEGLYSAFERNALQRQLQFQNLQLQDKIHNDNLSLRRDQMDWEMRHFTEKMQWQKKSFDKQLGIREEELDWGVPLGLATTGFALWEGARQRKETEKLTKRQNEINEALAKKLGI